MVAVAETAKARLDWNAVAPDVAKAMQSLEECVYKSGRAAGLEQSLLHLIKLRASQINGCAWCIDMHTKDARAEGETEQRLYLVSAWREAPFFSERERAALAWTEAVTLVSHDHVPDEVYEYARRSFNEKELVYLTLAIVAINGWNRLNVSMRTVAGDYQPQHPTS
jgi:AhpD family alkylhydroperoxidase